jgi:nitrite reductase (NADH) small subunit
MFSETQSGYCLGPLSQIPLGEGRAFQVGKHRIAVFRPRDGGVYATQAVCPHRGGPLADGLVGGTTLVCPLHAWKFELSSGKVLLGSQGIATYPIALTEQGDMVLKFGGLS